MAKILSFPKGVDITKEVLRSEPKKICPVCNNKNPQDFKLFFVDEAKMFQLTCLKCETIFILKDFLIWNEKVK